MHIIVLDVGKNRNATLLILINFYNNALFIF